MSLTIQWMWGSGSPVAWQWRMAVWPWYTVVFSGSTLKRMYTKCAQSYTDLLAQHITPQVKPDAIHCWAIKNPSKKIAPWSTSDDQAQWIVWSWDRSVKRWYKVVYQPQWGTPQLESPPEGCLKQYMYSFRHHRGSLCWSEEGRSSAPSEAAAVLHLHRQTDE